MLRRKIADEFLPRAPATRLAVTFESFGFKHGPARDADLVLDVRFLPNPHYEPTLRPLTGHDARVVAYIERDGRLAEFYERLVPLLDFLLPQYVAEGKAHLTIAIGCTGGRHRSVAIAEHLGAAVLRARRRARRGRAPRRRPGERLRRRRPLRHDDRVRPGDAGVGVRRRDGAARRRPARRRAPAESAGAAERPTRRRRATNPRRHDRNRPPHRLELPVSARPHRPRGRRPRSRGALLRRADAPARRPAHRRLARRHRLRPRPAGALDHAPRANGQASDGGPAAPATPAGAAPPALTETGARARHGHVAIAAAGRRAVDAAHRAGIAAGGRDGGAPAPRASGPPNYYSGYLVDPDGAWLELVSGSQ